MTGNPPTGKSVTWRAIHVLTLRDSKIAEHVTIMYRLSLLEQLGA
jgi:predicted ester cyclase